MTELVGVDIGTGHQAMNSNSRESRTENYFQGGSQLSSWSVWTALETYIQIQEAFGWQPITDALAAYYTMSDPPATDEQEFNRWVMELSQTTGYNLAPYHEAWGFPLTQETKDNLLHLPVWVDDPLRGVYENTTRCCATSRQPTSPQLRQTLNGTFTTTERELTSHYATAKPTVEPLVQPGPLAPSSEPQQLATTFLR